MWIRTLTLRVQDPLVLNDSGGKKMTTSTPNVFELRIVAFEAWWYNGDIDVALVRPSNVHPPRTSRTAGIRKSIQPPRLAIADSK